MLSKHRARELDFGRDGATPTVFDGLEAVIAEDTNTEKGSLVWSQPIALTALIFNIVLFIIGVACFPLVAGWLAPDVDFGPFKLSFGLLCGGLLVGGHHLLHTVHIRFHRQAELAQARRAPEASGKVTA